MLSLIKHIELFKRGTYMFKSAFHWLQTAGPSKVIHFAGCMRKTGLYGSVCQCGNFEISHSRLWAWACLCWMGLQNSRQNLLFIRREKTWLMDFLNKSLVSLYEKRTTHMNLQNVRFHFFLPFAAILAGLVSKKYFEWQKTCRNSFQVLQNKPLSNRRLFDFPLLGSRPVCAFVFWTILNLWCWF